MRLITSSLRAQLLAGFAAVIIIFGIGVAVAVGSLSTVTATLTSGTARMQLADQVRVDTFNMQGSALMNTLSDGAGAANHASDVAQFRANLAKVARALRTVPDRRAYASVAQQFVRWAVLDNRADALAAAHRRAAATALTTGGGAANVATDALSAAAARLAASIAAEDRHDAAASQRSATLTMIIIGLVAVILAIAIVMVLSQRIVGGVRQMLGAARSLAQGDVDQRIEVRGHDEVGAMAREFSAMIDYLRSTAAAAEQIAAGNFAVEIEPRSERDVLSHAFIELRDRVGGVVRAISGTSETLNTSSVQMAASTEDVGRAIAEIASSVGSVATGAEEQVCAIERVHTISEEVAAASRASSETAGETAQVAVEARASADAGEQAVAKVDDAMRGVQDSSVEVRLAIRTLGEKSSRIGGIVDTINAIAEQTNLLALNAAIEAARAGEQGRGFAVVAEEVRKLAEESQAATASIANLVAEIRSETERAVLVVEQGAKQTEIGVRTVSEAREAFQQIRVNVEAMTPRIELIAASSAQILAGALRMQDSVSAVASVAEQSSASTEQVSAASQQTSASTQQIASSAHHLSSTADELQSLVAQFTLGDMPVG